MKHALALALAIAIASAPAYARKATYGDWIAEEAGDYTEAYTSNESGSVFGLICGRECVFYLNILHKCERGDSYPAMINSDAGAYSVDLKCFVLDGDYIMTFSATGDFADILEAGGTIGFAVPLANGQFGVSRFSLKGGIDAASAATRSADGRSGGRQGLRDLAI
jgi:hypothetical protein